MGILRLPGLVQRQQPQVAAEVDWSNPISRGLVSYMPLIGKSYRDAADGLSWSVVAAGAPIAFETLQRGSGMRVKGTTPAYVTRPLPAAVTSSGTQPATIRFRLYFHSVAATHAVMSWGSIAQDGTPRFYVHLSGSSLQFFFSSGYHTAQPVVAEREYIVTHTFDGITMCSYLDGVLFSTSAGSGWAQNFASLYLGTGYDGQAAASDFLLSDFTMWNRALSPQEVASDVQNPWQIVRPFPRILAYTPTPQKTLKLAGTKQTAQPQGTVTVDRSGIGASLALATMPGLSRNNIVSGVPATVGGTAPSGSSFVGVAPEGLDLMIHPAGGTNGFGGLRFGAETIDSSSDFTFIWIGRPQNYTTANGQLMVRGADSSGNGWNLAIRYEGNSQLSAYVVDSSPAAFNAAITGLTLATNQHQRVALVKRGNTITVYDWRTRQSAAASAGNGALRTSTLGIGLGFDGSGSPAGHNKPNTVLAFSKGLDSAAVWSLLDNPWQLFEAPHHEITMAAPAALAAPSTSTAAPTGVAAATAVGVAVPSAGSVTTATGVSATSAIGSAVESGGAKVTPVGTSATALTGTVIASGASVGTALPVGVSANSSVGVAATSATANVTITGVTSFAVVGSAQAVGYGVASVSGLVATTAIGTVQANGTSQANPVGVSATSSVGAPSGVGYASITVVGVSATASITNPLATGVGSGTALPTGVNAATNVGSLATSAGAQIVVSGIGSTASVRTVIVSGYGYASVTGVSALGSVGTVTFLGSSMGATVPLSRTVVFASSGTNRVTFAGGTNKVTFDGGTNKVTFSGGTNKVVF